LPVPPGKSVNFAPLIIIKNKIYMKSIVKPFRHLLLIGSFLLVGSVFVTSCKKTTDPAPVVTPTLGITSVSPGTGAAGTVVTITGTGFDGTTSSNNQVSFGTTAATVLTSTPTAVVTQVPGGITGNFPIVVTTGGKSVTATSQFNVTTVIGK
jgi:hypothetical protein